MRRVALCFFACLMALVTFAAPGAQAIFGTPRVPPLEGGQNGGADCAACTLLLGLVSQTMQLKQVQAEQAMDDFCGYLPGSAVKDLCKLAVSVVGKDVAPLLNKGESADAVCNAIGACKADTAVCRLFGGASKESDAAFARRTADLAKEAGPRAAVTLTQVLPMFRAAAAAKKKGGNTEGMLRESGICKWFPEVCQVEDHLPAFDTDRDDFSTYETLRGSYWRGKDCDDLDASVFPGRESADGRSDANCNGIAGVDTTTGQTYENMWCNGTGAMGVAALGDSATAHFHIPPSYVNASELSSATFAHVLRFLENEADWPMLSWSTGHLNASGFAPDISGPVSSVYSRLLEHNRCNHRDFANLGVNGARVDKLKPFDMLLNRNRSNTVNPVKPLLTIMSMVGNDVCNGHHTFETMTTPEEYKASIVAALDEADSFLPAGSAVILIPLVDGRILFDTMHDRIHPIGWTNKDVTYTDLYSFLNCLDISPCWGWMNANATVRNTTWQVASSLNAQLPIIASESKSKYHNIQVRYLGNVFDAALDSFTGERWKLIEPVDGFHPSQLANSLLGDSLFEAIEAAGGIIGPANPNNAAIQARFGDQGGY